MRYKISQKNLDSSIALTVLTSLMVFSFFSGQPCYGGFHPDRSTDGTSWSDSNIHLMKLEKQILWAKANLSIPNLGWDDLNYLSAIAETRTSALFQAKPQGFPDGVSYLNVKASIFLQILEISLLSQGSKRQRLIEEKGSSLDIPSSMTASDYPQSETNGEKWFGFIKIVNSDNFVWIPDSDLELFPLLEKLVRTLSIAFYIEPRLDLFSRSSLPLFQQTYSGQILVTTLAMEDLFFRIMQFEFLRKSLEAEVSSAIKDQESLPSEQLLKSFSGRIRNAQIRDHSEYLQSVLMNTQPGSAFLSKDFFPEMRTWFSSLPQGSLYTQKDGLGLADHKRQFLDNLENLDRFSLEKMKRNAFASNQFYQFTLIQDFVSLKSRRSCLKLVR
ncbi:MAG: hypothetical protein IPJ71_03790 [Bdellovibrionales bacterium]|jgi:hypothetical protein|nr:hypothetical protein [Bdellovibrionales bacterium]